MTCDPVVNKVHTNIDIDPETLYNLYTKYQESTGFEYVHIYFGLK